jgi:predicted DNA-binding transcriptional regulator YafY
MVKHVDRHERLKWFHGEIKAERFPNAAKLAEQFGVSTSTAHHDIETLREELGAPLSYDPHEHGFSYESGGFELPPMNGSFDEATAPPDEGKLTEGELVLVVAAEMMAKQHRTSPFADVIQRAFEKVTESMDDTVSYDRASLKRILEADIHPFPPVDLGVFDALARAIEHHETVVLKYFSGQKATVTDKICDPLHIINYKDNWYLVAFCHEKKAFRDFLMNRVMAVEYTGVKSAPYTDFNIDKHKRESQLFRGMESPVEVVIEFDKFAAHWIRLRPVHPTQHIVERADGSLEISFKVYTFENLLRWVLSFGEHARVLAPLELQERVHKTIGKMNQLYNRF